MNIEVGDYVIVNDIDRPCEKLIAKVIQVKLDDKNKKIYASRYINARVSKEYKNKILTCTPTKVESFGQKVEIFTDIQKYRVTEDHLQEKIATYADGKLREWQGSNERELNLASWCLNG